MFKRSADKLEKLLKDADVVVKQNPVKARKGTFSVRIDEGGDYVIELVSMPRPFKKLRETNIEELAEKVIAACGSGGEGNKRKAQEEKAPAASKKPKTASNKKPAAASKKKKPAAAVSKKKSATRRSARSKKK